MTKIKCALLFIDLQKAFDRIHHDFLFDLLLRLGFLPRTVRVLQNMVTGLTAKISVNCQKSKPIQIRRGVPQGNPLSMYLFAVSLEPLLRAAHARLTGITLSGHKTVIRAFADDVGVVIRNQGELLELRRIIQRYCSASGAHVNENKCTLLNLEGFQRVHCDWAKLEARYKTLGTILTPCAMNMAAQNWREALGKLKGAVIANSRRQLNQVERVKLVNNCILSKAFYTAQSFPLPKMIGKKIMSLMASFLWKGEVFRVNLQTATLDYSHGGLGLVDIRNKASALFLRRTVNMFNTSPDAITTKLFECVRPPSLQPPVNVQSINKKLKHVRTFYVEFSYISTTLQNSKTITTKDILRERQRNEGVNKIERKFPEYNWKVIWHNISFTGLDFAAISAWYRLVNNIVATNDRLYSIGKCETNLCIKCNLVDTVIHRLTCSGQLKNWYWLRDSIALLTRSSPDYISSEILYRPQIKYYPQAKNNAVHWIMGKFVSYVINNIGTDSEIDFQIYMRSEFQKIITFSDHKKKYGNMLKIIFERTGVG